MKKYKKTTGGSLTLADGRTIEKGDIFEAEEKSIPKSFRVGLEVLGDVKVEKPKAPKEPEAPTRTTPTKKNTVRTK